MKKEEIATIKMYKDFLGFYVRGRVSSDILMVLRREYPNKILFNGKKIIGVEGLR